MTEASSGSGRIMFVTEEDMAGSLVNTTTTATTATTMAVNITTSEAPYNGEESENRLEGVVSFSFSNLTNLTSEIMSNVTSQLTIRDQEDAQEVKIFQILYLIILQI